MSDGWTTPGGPAPDDPGPRPADPAAGWAGVPTRPGWNDYGMPPTAPKPGIIPLRPLTVGELLDGAFTTIRRYPAATLGLSALVMLVVSGVQLLASYLLLNGISDTAADGSVSGDYLSRSATVDLAVLVVTVLAGLVLAGGITAVVGQAVLGRPMTGGQAWRTARARLVPLLGVVLLVLAAVLLVMVVALLPGIVVALAGAHGAGIALVALGSIGAVLVVIWLAVTVQLAAPAVVLERQGVVAALRRSRSLVAGSWWRVFGIVALSTIIAELVSGIIAVPFGLAAGHASLFSSTGSPLTFSSLLIADIGGFIAGTIVRPFSAGVVALLYIDRRMRAEALDLTLQRAAAGDG